MPKPKIISGTVPEIGSKTDRIFCRFGPFFVLLLSPKNPENQNFEKMKKASEDVNILHMCTKIRIIWCILPEIWSMTDIIFLSFCTIFCPFTQLMTWKFKIWKKFKTWIYYPFIHMYHKWRSYDVWFPRCNLGLRYGALLTAQKIKY